MHLPSLPPGTLARSANTAHDYKTITLCCCGGGGAAAVDAADALMLLLLKLTPTLMPQVAGDGVTGTRDGPGYWARIDTTTSPYSAMAVHPATGDVYFATGALCALRKAYQTSDGGFVVTTVAGRAGSRVRVVSTAHPNVNFVLLPWR